MRRSFVALVATALLAACSADGGVSEDDNGMVFGFDSGGKNPAGTGDTLGEDAIEIPPCDADEDGDGFGDGCFLGPDCDEGNPMLNVYCPPCDYGIYEGCTCTNPGSQIDCYPDEASFIGIGECKAGQQTCDDGYWGPCFGYVTPYAEECDYLDNDCDGEVDEEVLNPCGDCNAGCNALGAGPDDEYGFDLNEESSSGVAENVDGYIVLDSESFNIQYIWIANSGESTVSKINTETGKEEGRYDVCSNPSRTAVDLYGDVWVGCRNDGGVAKILVHELMCEDKDGNGTIETSKDVDGNGVISGGEMLANGTDECVKFQVNPGGSCQRALGVDKQNHGWAGAWNEKMLRRMDPDDGHVVQEIGIPANPYGLVIDKGGVIWVSGRGGSVLVRADPANNDVQSFTPGGSFDPYGIALDYKGRIWTGNCCSEHVAYRFDPQAGTFAKAPTSSRPRGLVGSLDGKVYVANDESNKVAVVNADTLQTTGYVDLGSGRFPIGMTIDFDGFIWAVNQSSASATKINSQNLSVVGEYPTGTGPYTYSDMTGYMLHAFTNPTGYYKHLFGGWGLRLRWTGLIVDAYLPGGTSIKVRFRAGNTEEELAQLPWGESIGPFPPQTFPLDLMPYNLSGHYLQVEISLFASEDGVTPIVKGIEIQFDNGHGGE